MAKDEHPARVWIQGHVIHYTIGDFEAWRVPLEKLRVVGEYTRPNGPWADDYFFVFLTEEYWFEASFYARGGLELFGRLSEELKQELLCGLQSSTHWKSRVIWPSDLKEEPLFEIVAAPMPSGLWNKIRYKLTAPVELHLTGQVRDKVGGLWKADATPS